MLDRRCVQAHLRTSRPSVGTGSRGPDGPGLRRDSRWRWRPTAPSRRAAPARRGPGRRRRSSSRSSSCPRRVPPAPPAGPARRRPTATVNMVCSAAVRAGVRIAVRAVGNHERDDQFWCVVKDLRRERPAARRLRPACRRRSGRHATGPSSGPAAGFAPIVFCIHTNRTGRVWCGAGAVSASATALLDESGATGFGPKRRTERRSSWAWLRPSASASSVPSQNRSSSPGRSNVRALDPSSRGRRPAHHRDRDVRSACPSPGRRPRRSRRRRRSR